MATMAEALADVSKLEPFEGQDVLAAGIEIPGAAGGLREAMKIDPQQFHHGEKVFVVLECEVAKVRFDEIKDSGGALRRVHVFNVEGSTIVDEDLVRVHLDAQAERIEEARIAAEEARGIQRLPYEGTDELMLEHEKGDHADERMDGCPLCEEERAAEEAGD